MRKNAIFIILVFSLIVFSLNLFTGCNETKKRTLISTPTPTSTPTMTPTPTPTPITGSVSGKISFAVSGSATRVIPATNTYFPSVKVNPHNLVKAAAVANEKIITFQPGLTRAQVDNIIQELHGQIKNKIYGTENTFVVSITTSDFSATAINNNLAILSVSDNHLFYTCAIPNDPYYSTQAWNYEMMNLPAAWDLQHGSSSVVVAVIDTGVSLTHPDLATNLDLANAYDFVDDDSDPSDSTYYNETYRYSHGTHVAGIISAVTNNSTGVAGVAWNVKIMPIRVLGSNNEGSTANIVAGINWAVTHGAKVINMSISGSNGDSAL